MPSPSPSAPLHIILVGTRPGATPPTCDPALNLDAPGISQALTRYERERSDEARAALPLLPDARPSVFVVQPMTPAMARYAASAPNDEARAQWIFGAVCHAFTDESGREHHARDHGGGLTSTGPKGFDVAADEWIDHVAGLYGLDGIREVASVARARAEAGPRALAPFRLPPGLMLAR